MNVLHQDAALLVAMLPQVEQGVLHFLTKSGEKVLLHRIAQVSGAVLNSVEMNMPLLRAVVGAVDQATL